jgi:alkylation response protein AidB-like acyl-CoA dehydrogenase
VITLLDRGDLKAKQRGRIRAPGRDVGADGVPGAATRQLGGAGHGDTGPVDLTLTPSQLELRDRARAYVLDVLQPLEAEFERRNGTLPDDAVRDAKRRAVEARLHGGSLPREVGGQNWTTLEQVLVHEQLGQATGGLWSYIPGAYNALVH